MNPSHEHWSKYDNFSGKIRKHVATLVELRAEQIRPLMLACIKRFSTKDVERAYRMFIHWSVRFIIAGVATGNVEKYYAGRAADVWSQKIKTADDLAKAMIKNVPGNEQFKPAFQTLRVSKPYLARYLLRALELAAENDPAPEHVVNDDATTMTLEHVLPQTPSADWYHIAPEVAEVASRRLGNMMLLKAGPNSVAGNIGFAAKQAIYKNSTVLLLNHTVIDASKWDLEEINTRQGTMADLAIKAWPAP
jgi:hypothetical protein